MINTDVSSISRDKAKFILKRKTLFSSLSRMRGFVFESQDYSSLSKNEISDGKHTTNKQTKQESNKANGITSYLFLLELRLNFIYEV